MTNTGPRDVILDADGRVAVMISGKAVWRKPADINAVDAANPPFIVV